VENVLDLPLEDFILKIVMIMSRYEVRMTKALAKITKFEKKTMIISAFVVSLQASFRRGGRSQKKKLISLPSQKEREKVHVVRRMAPETPKT
jgi:hypothetical protein